MRYILQLILLLLLSIPTKASEPTIDSLHTALNRTNIPVERIRLLQDLADITFESQESCSYLYQIYQIAKDQGNTRRKMEALTDLAFTHIALDQTDSVRHYIDIAEQEAPPSERDQWCSYPRMRLFAVELLGDESDKAMTEKIESIRQGQNIEKNLYKSIESEYALGTALYNDAKYQDAIPYLIRALEASEQLPFREGTPYQLLILRQLTRVYNILLKKELAVETVKRSIALKEEYYKLYDKDHRPFYPIDDFYITQISTLMINVDVLPEIDIQHYIGRIKTMLGRVKQPHAKYSCFLTLSNYYVNRRNFSSALSCNDSLIFYARKIAQYNLPGLYSVGSVLNEKLNQPAEALLDLKESYRLRDSISRENENTQLNKLRVEYDLNRLNYENSKLEIQNKKMMIVSQSIILIVTLMLCIYLYIHLRRERKYQRRLQQLKLLAEESEKLKTGFINSLCHEIRTPLNSIVGYSELLFDNSVDQDIRESFPAIIRQNTKMLVGHIDSMIEVSRLEVSDEPLPCQSIDIAHLCRNSALEYFATHDNENVKGRIDIPDSQLIVNTNNRYLWLVIENLLSNAYKFTDSGEVVVKCSSDQQQVIISITDTGCGIPITQHKAVFDRFIKLDTYKDGTGLGLYICQRIVGRLSAKIFIDPTYTSGTRVIVSLPLK